jgi:uncharacterized protein
MPDIVIRQIEPTDFARVLELNADAVQHTSVLDLVRLIELDALSSYHKVLCVDGSVAAFLLAMRESALYVNDNFAFFASRYDHFIYVDRIVVDPAFSGLKIGSLLYQDLFQYARSNGLSIVACEYNIEPSNEPSRRFHDKFGFTEIGTQWLDGCKKRVSLQVADIRL